MAGSIAAPGWPRLVGDFDRRAGVRRAGRRAPPADRRRPGRHSTCGCRASATSASPSASPAPRSPARTPHWSRPGSRSHATGSGTFTRLPGGRRQMLDRTLTPRPTATTTSSTSAARPVRAARASRRRTPRRSLTCRATSAATATSLPACPALQEAVAASYDARGLPTDPAQIMVVPGALSALMIVAQALVGPRDRVLVESPGYPNAHAALRRAGARLVARADGRRRLGPRRGRPDRCGRPGRRLAYLIPDFQNPTGNLMGDAQREEYAALLRRTGTVAVVDESHSAARARRARRCRGRSRRTPRTRSRSAARARASGAGCGWAGCAARAGSSTG